MSTNIHDDIAKGVAKILASMGYHKESGHCPVVRRKFVRTPNLYICSVDPFDPAGGEFKTMRCNRPLFGALGKCLRCYTGYEQKGNRFATVAEIAAMDQT